MRGAVMQAADGGARSEPNGTRAVSPRGRPPRSAWSYFIHGGETDTGTEHLCAEGVSQLMRDNALGDSDSGDDIMPGIAQLADERVATTGAGQEKAVGREGILGAQQTEAANQPTNERIHRARFSTCRWAHGWPS